MGKNGLKQTQNRWFISQSLHAYLMSISLVYCVGVFILLLFLSKSEKSTYSRFGSYARGSLSIKSETDTTTKTTSTTATHSFDANVKRTETKANDMTVNHNILQNESNAKMKKKCSCSFSVVFVCVCCDCIISLYRNVKPDYEVVA